jgi:hypothetical protein
MNTSQTTTDQQDGWKELITKLIFQLNNWQWVVLVSVTAISLAYVANHEMVRFTATFVLIGIILPAKLAYTIGLAFQSLNANPEAKLKFETRESWSFTVLVGTALAISLVLSTLFSEMVHFPSMWEDLRPLLFIMQCASGVFGQAASAFVWRKDHS